MSEFSDRPFVAGSLIGIRAFKPVGDRLVAPVQGTWLWRPGENVAACLPALSWPLASTPTQDHRAGSMGCRCGFYAYFQAGYNPHTRPGDIFGLIEGYGVVTVGTRGFRCEKARIVALIAPDVPDFDLGFVFANYPDVPVFPSVDAAVAEFPLTVPEGTPPPPTHSTAIPMGIVVNVSLSANAFFQSMKKVMEELNAVSTQTGKGMAKLAEALREPLIPSRIPPTDQRARALQLRRNRNTGPVDPYRLTRRRSRNQP